MATNTSAPDDAQPERVDGSEDVKSQSHAHPQFETVLSYDAGSQVVLCDRENTAAWIAMDAADVRSREELR
ncbi:DUF7331 family protein [Natronolimnohabitans innermongolicus]|uniref:Uncharacterized protein n=1 Tax=Natronolimnohabitans innermongolicus JCM 12255 TaxID=1227499 RepID=L9WX30_9EURY|nr:hypothetical protein [Natronolimnohabitans innermongolicus]ELY52913.1 hypothetical protein C493_15433 [Natronolimnohabitans innermongolicus JCM 12255]